MNSTMIENIVNEGVVVQRSARWRWAALALGLVACGGKEGRVEEVLALEGDATSGAEVYAVNCAGCHGADGGGGSGPNIRAKTARKRWPASSSRAKTRCPPTTAT
ncbi:MAG: c-type cytochrome [Deltaproteobacteria bacterium]|nr:c-type cytochrome [Deltaproteobacteria bacterium]